MKILHILKTELDQTVQTLLDITSAYGHFWISPLKDRR
jgi:hypothetical protein